MKLIYLLVAMLLVLPLGLNAQEKKPKVVLVLSGGGAKGIAHIPVLQKLDSLGIVPDLIVGTSMGSVIGGLYASGYTGDEIEQLTSKVEWGEILGGTISLRDVGVEEKSEFTRYLINLDIVEGKPKVKSSILKDQNLRELLSTLFYPVYKIQNFDDLPIPFRSVTTDLVNGKEVVLGSGSLSLAVRASMSIPSVFEPVKYNGTLLVDGGILNNFPTDVAKQMGADIIIGSDVGGGMAPIEELSDIATIMFQTSMITSNLKNPKNQALCDILIDHYPNLSYSTQDFDKASIIYKEGLIASNQNVNALVKLAQKLKKFKQRSKPSVVIKDELSFDKIEYNDISSENMSLLKARMNIVAQKIYSTDELKQAIDRAMGTEVFDQITYAVTNIEGENKLVLRGYEKAKNQISGALHYDTVQGVGIGVNYTGRNILGTSSRILIGADIAEQPKFRVEYQQNIGATKKWWWRGQVYGQKSKQSYYFNGNLGEELKNSFYKTSLQLNKNINSFFSYFGLDLNYERFRTKPKLSPSISNNLYDLREYTSDNFEVSMHYALNSMDKVFFSTKGTLLNARISRSLMHKVNVQFDESFINNAPGSTNGFSKFSFEFEERMPFKKHFSFIINATSGLTFIDSEQADKISFSENGQGAQYALGGNFWSNRRDSFIFGGLNESELIVTQFIKTTLGLQVNVAGNFYVTPYLNLAAVGFDDTESFFKNLGSSDNKWTETSGTSNLFSAGTTLSYQSILGPVNFDMAYVNHVSSMGLFFSVGLNLNIPH